MKKHLFFTFLLFFVRLCTSFGQSVNIVKDLNPGNGYGVISTGGDFSSVGNKIVFAGTTSGFPIELFTSDGTAANTKKVGTVSAAEPEIFTPAGPRSFFTAYGANGTALFHTDGSNVQNVKTFSNPYLEGILPLADNKVLVTVGTSFGEETQLWVGTTAGATKIADMEVNSDFIVASKFKNSGVYFEKSTNSIQTPPFLSDGTAAGTKTIADWIAPVFTFSAINSAVGTGDHVFVSGNKVENGFQFRKTIFTDGTALGTKEFAFTDDIRAVFKRDSAAYFLLGESDISLYNPVNNKVTALQYNLYYFGTYVFDGKKVYYHSDDGIWETDGTSAGTKKMDVTPLGNSFYNPQMILANGTLYYTVSGSTNYELWGYKLSSKTNTRITDTYPKNGLIFTPILAFVNNRLVFSRFTTAQGTELWSTDVLTNAFEPEPLGLPMRISPNPSADIVTLEVNDLGGDLNIFDLRGQCVKQDKNLAATHISLLDLPNGTYWLHYRFQGVVRVAQVVKQ